MVEHFSRRFLLQCINSKKYIYVEGKKGRVNLSGINIFMYIDLHTHTYI